MTDVEKRVRSLGPLKLAIVVLALVAMVVPVVAVMAASPDPSTDASASAAAASASPESSATSSPAPASSAPAAAPEASAPNGLKPDASKPSVKNDGQPGNLRGFGGGRGFGGVTIAAIDGSKLSLKTVDGWTRTIVVTADTTITKGGQAIKVGDLDVGDTIVFRQKRNDDGTYSIVAIVVPTPKAAGEVTALTSSTMTLKGRGDKTRTITLTGSTIYTLGKTKGAKSDLAVGSRVVVEGTISGDTFTALSVHIALSNAAGEVTAKTANTITVKGRGGKTTVIHVSSDTMFKVRGKDAATARRHRRRRSCRGAGHAPRRWVARRTDRPRASAARQGLDEGSRRLGHARLIAPVEGATTIEPMAWNPSTDPFASDALATTGRQEEIELVGTHLRVIGTIALGRFGRLSDLINASSGYVRVRNARLLLRNGDPTDLVLPEMMFDKDEISFIAQRAPENPGQAWGIAGAGAATDFGGNPELDRAPRQFVMFTPGHTVTGFVHVYGETDLAGFVESSDQRFVSVVDVTTRSLADRRVINHFKFVLINRTQMIAASEVGRTGDVSPEDVPEL